MECEKMCEVKRVWGIKGQQKNVKGGLRRKCKTKILRGLGH